MSSMAYLNLAWRHLQRQGLSPEERCVKLGHHYPEAASNISWISSAEPAAGWPGCAKFMAIWGWTHNQRMPFFPSQRWINSSLTAPSFAPLLELQLRSQVFMNHYGLKLWGGIMSVIKGSWWQQKYWGGISLLDCVQWVHHQAESRFWGFDHTTPTVWPRELTLLHFANNPASMLTSS